MKLAEASSNAMSEFARIVESARENFRQTVGYRIRITRDIQRHRDRLNQIESILPITKQSVRRKELLRKKKSQEEMIKKLQEDYRQSLRNG